MSISTVAGGQSAGERAFDPILVEVMNNEVSAVSEEMALTISRSARSPMVRGGDFAAGLADEQGRIIGQGYAAPMQLAQFMSLMQSLRNKYPDEQLHPDDVFVANDPYQGSGHMPDIAVIRPIFWQGGHVGYAVAYSHQNDTGGRFPGGMSSECRSSYEEGLRLPMVKLYDAGRRDESLLDLILANVRGPDVWIGDVEAKMAGCWRGAREFSAILDRHGLQAYRQYSRYVVDRAEAAMRTAIAAIPDGSYAIVDDFEDDGFGTPGAAIRIQISIQVTGDQMVVDFDGTASQQPSAINMGFSQTKACIHGALKILVPSDVQMNPGLVRPIEVRAPAGCLVNPIFPAAVGGRGPLASRVRVLFMLCLGRAVPDRIPVPSEGADSLHALGKTADGREFVMLDGFFGGWGGRPMDDGIDGVAPMEFGAYGVTSAEVMGARYPVILEEFQYVPDSAGAGTNRGSMSTRRTWRFLQPATAMIRTTRFTPSAGLAGGGPAGQSGNRLVRSDGTVEVGVDQMHWRIAMQPGDRLEHVIGGTGGYGPALRRQPAKVLADVRSGKVTAEGARSQYGVVLSGGDGAGALEVDIEATARLRAEVVVGGGAAGAAAAGDAAGSSGTTPAR